MNVPSRARFDLSADVIFQIRRRQRIRIVVDPLQIPIPQLPRGGDATRLDPCAVRGFMPT